MPCTFLGVLPEALIPDMSGPIREPGRLLRNMAWLGQSVFLAEVYRSLFITPGWWFVGPILDIS